MCPSNDSVNVSRMDSIASVNSFFAPKRVVVVGASDDTEKTGGRALDYLKRFSFPGEIFAVNPIRKNVQDIDAYPSVAALPETPDLAIIAVPVQHVLEAISECGEKRIPGAIVTTSGFAELGNSGRRLQEEMLQRARGYGLRLVGPNSQGIANFSTQTVASFSSLFLTYPPKDGPVAILSQSGSMSVVPYCALREQGIGVRYCVATGNEADLTIGDFAEYVAADSDVKLILIYSEAIVDTEPLIRAARLARERGIPLVALKAGRTAGGRSAALSHTGALANEDRVVSAFLEHYGMWRVDDTDALLRAVPLYLKQWQPRGRRLAILTDSGASAVMLADTADQLDMELAQFPAATVKELESILPSYAAVKNPVDMTSVLRAQPQLFGAVLDHFARHDVADLYVVAFPASGAGYDVPGLAKMAADFCHRTGHALVVAVPQPPIAKHFREVGLPTYASETEALAALRQLAAHCGLLNSTDECSALSEFPSPPRSEPRLMREDEAFGYLETLGLPVASFQVCRNTVEVENAFRQLGPRIVLKVLSQQIAHKAKLGLVALGIDTLQDALDSYEQLVVRSGELNTTVDGILVAKHHLVDFELFVGAKVDPVFGPVLTVGEGGYVVEEGRGLIIRLAPITLRTADEIVARLCHRFCLEGLSNAAKAMLAKIIESVSQLIAVHATRILSVDLNPVAVTEGEVVILDALVEMQIEG